MVDFPSFAGLDDQCALRAGTFPHKVVVDACGREEARNRRVLLVDAPVRQNDQAVTRRYGRACALAQFL